MPLTKIGKEGITGVSNSSDATAITISNSEKIGIGTNSPDGGLHVKGSSDHGRIVLESGGNSGSTNNTFIQFHNSGGTEVAQITVEESATNQGQIVLKTGGTTTAMTISKDGFILKPLHPAFKAGLNTNTTFGASATVVFNDTASSSTHFNRGNHYSTSTGKFTAPVDGIYFFGVGLIFMSMGDGDNMNDSFYIRKNTNTLICYSHRRAEYVAGSTGNAGYFTDFAHVTTELSANETVFVQTRENRTVHGNTNYSYFHGYFIG